MINTINPIITGPTPSGSVAVGARLRSLPPALGACSPWEATSFALHLMSRCSKRPSTDSLTHLVEEFYRECRFLHTSCGKDALLFAFQALKKTYGVQAALLGAYTCPDIVTAAVAAGLEVHLLDIHPRSLEPLPSTASHLLKHKKVAVVLSNLYGLPDRVSVLEDDGLVSGGVVGEVYLVDDACQAALSWGSSFGGGSPSGGVSRFGSSGGPRVGGRAKSACGILSFGRGKAISGVGGGGLLIPETNSELLATSLSLRSEWLSRYRTPGILTEIAIAGYAQLMWIFQNPYLYGLPASLPFLKLGKTPVHWDWGHSAMTTVEQIYSGARFLALDRIRRELLIRSRLWSDGLSMTDVVQPLLERNYDFSGEVVCIRYPLIFPTAEVCERVYHVLSRNGLGATRSYGRALGDFPELVGRLSYTSIAGARSVASTLLTVPIHPAVREQDIAKAIELIKKSI